MRGMVAKAHLPSPETMKVIEMYNERLAEIEANYKFTRAAAKETLIQAIENEGMSLATAARLSGHDRRTIKVWLDVHNAAKKSGQKSN
jgi:transcriptional regulator with GAF, ATPase, and Fis domain